MYSFPARLRNDILCLLRLSAQLLLRTRCNHNLNCLVIYGAGEHQQEAKAIGAEYWASSDTGAAINKFCSEWIFWHFDSAQQKRLLTIFEQVTPLQEKAGSISIPVSRKCCVLFSHLLLPQWHSI